MRIYAVAMCDQARALEVLRSRMEVVGREEYGKIYRYVEEVRPKSEEARRRLLQHIAEHGC